MGKAGDGGHEGAVIGMVSCAGSSSSGGLVVAHTTGRSAQCGPRRRKSIT